MESQKDHNRKSLPTQATRLFPRDRHHPGSRMMVMPSGRDGGFNVVAPHFSQTSEIPQNRQPPPSRPIPNSRMMAMPSGRDGGFGVGAPNFSPLSDDSSYRRYYGGDAALRRSRAMMLASSGRIGYSVSHPTEESSSRGEGRALDAPCQANPTRPPPKEMVGKGTHTRFESSSSSDEDNAPPPFA